MTSSSTYGIDENTDVNQAKEYDVSCFFFSSRRRHTRLQGDWSSDVCSSDLIASQRPEVIASVLPASDLENFEEAERADLLVIEDLQHLPARAIEPLVGLIDDRSEERRVGKEGRSRWSPYH